MTDQIQALETTKRFYDDNAGAYAAGVAKVDFGSLWDKFAALLPAGAEVLDLGCGGGRDLRALAARGLRPTGLDYSASLAQIARTESGQPVVVADLLSCDFGEARFDGMWAIASLLHVPRNEISAVLGAMYGALRPGGVLLTSMQAGSGCEVSADGRFFELYRPDEWQELVREAGFQTRAGTVTQVKGRTGNPDITWFVTIGIKEP